MKAALLFLWGLILFADCKKRKNDDDDDGCKLFGHGQTIRCIEMSKNPKYKVLEMTIFLNYSILTVKAV